MADTTVGDEMQWFSAELRILEAEYEKSKLRVFQDTLLCKRSMVELELLCKNEQLRKNTRDNNKIKEHEYQLKEQLESLSTELKNATNQLQTAQNTLQTEKAHHELEKKKLGDKLNSEMKKKMEEQRESASHRENLLQKEIKNWQDKHVKTSKEAEDLRMELSKKNVAVKTKAIQTRVTVEDASTTTEADPQTSDVGVQVQQLALDEGSRTNDGDVREIVENIREMNETGKGRNRMSEPKGRNKQRKEENGGQETGVKQMNGKSNKKGKEANKVEEKENEIIDENKKNERPKASRKRKSSRPTQPERASSPNSAPVMLEKQEVLNERTRVSNALLVPSSALQEDDIPLQYSKTPRLRKKSDESSQSLEKNTEQSDISTCSSDGAAAYMAQTSSSKKPSAVSEKEFSQLTVCLKDTGDKQEVTSYGEEREEEFHEEDVKNDKDNSAKKSSPQQLSVEERQSRVLAEEDKGFRSLNERQTQTEEKDSAAASKRETTFETVENKETNSVQNINEKKRKTEKKRKKVKRTKKTKRTEPANKKVTPEESGGGGNENKGGRVLRSKVKKQNSGAEIGSCKGQGEDRNGKSLGKETRQTPHDCDDPAATKKCKTDNTCLKGHEPTMLLLSSPEAHQLPRESKLSSREMDPLVDKPRPSRGVTSRATRDDSSQEPETELQGELNENNNKVSQSEHPRDYNSGQESLVLKDNRIQKVECLHKSSRQVKSGDFSSGKNGEKDSPERKNNKRIDLSSKKSRRSKQARQKVQDIDNAVFSKRQAPGAVETGNNASSTSLKTKTTSPVTDHLNGKGKNPAEQHVTVSGKTTKTLKENAPTGKKRGKKRKPTSSVLEVLAPADQQSSSDGTTSTEISAMLDNTKKRKTLFNSRENSLMVSASKVQMSFVNTTLSKSRTSTGIPPSLSAFMRSFIAPKLKKSH